MKSYNEVANNVFLRRSEYECKKQHRRDVYRRVSTVVSSVAIALCLITSVGTCYVLAVNNGLIDDFLGVLHSTEIEYQINEKGEIIDPMPDWGITMSAEDITPSGLTLCLTQSGGNIPERLIVGTEFYLEIQTDTGWEVMEANDGSNVWNFTENYLSANETVKFEIDWTNMYGELSPGTYRVRKTVSDLLPTDAGQSYTYSIEFIVQ